MFGLFRKKKKKQTKEERLHAGLKKTSGRLGSAISSLVNEKKLGEDIINELEEILLGADIGINAVTEILQDFREDKFDKKTSLEEIKEILAEKIITILTPTQQPLNLNSDKKPQIILVSGVNGVGKTTTIGKLAAKFGNDGKKVVIAACDTFRAAAESQLGVWADRADAKIIMAEKENADPAAVAYKALEEAQKTNADILIVDTAGRLHNQQNLMDQLGKIVRVMRKLDANAPHNSLLILDATTGQNAKKQLEIFKNTTEINGLVITKLDGSAKGGIIVALAKEFNIPIHYIGVGEGLDDLQEFNAESFTKNLIAK